MNRKGKSLFSPSGTRLTRKEVLLAVPAALCAPVYLPAAAQPRKGDAVNVQIGVNEDPHPEPAGTMPYEMAGRSEPHPPLFDFQDVTPWRVEAEGVDARLYRTREQRLCRAYESVAELHNQLGLTDPVAPTTRSYHGRPFQVLHAERFTGALRARIIDPAVRVLPLVGAVDQFIDSTDALADAAALRAAVAALLHPAPPSAR